MIDRYTQNVEESPSDPRGPVVAQPRISRPARGEARPRVIFITGDMPRDGGSGGQIVSFRLLQAYGTFAEVDVLALTPPGVSVPPELGSLVRRVAMVPMARFYYRSARLKLTAMLARSQLGGRPYRLAKFDVPEARLMLRDWMQGERYDLAHLDGLGATTYAAELAGLPFVFLAHNVEWQLLESVAAAHSNPVARAVLGREAERTRPTEVSVARRSIHTLTLCEQDRLLFLEEDPGLDGKVSAWPVPAPDAPLVAPKRGGDEPLTLLVLGSMGSGQRLDGLRWFLGEVWPRARRALPGLRLLVVGRGAPPDIAARGGRDGIGVLGFVEDLEPILRQVDLCIIPLLAGGGIRVKIVELIARGIPCLGTALGVRGCGHLDGVFTADEPDDWVAQLTQAAQRPESLRRAAESGRSTLRSRQSLEAAALHLREACAGVPGKYRVTGTPRS